MILVIAIHLNWLIRYRNQAEVCFMSESQFNGVQDKLRIKNIVEVNFTKGTKLLMENYIKTDNYEQSKF